MRAAVPSVYFEPSDDRGDAERDEQHAGPEVLGIADRRHRIAPACDRRCGTRDGTVEPVPRGAQDSIAVAGALAKKRQAAIACPFDCACAANQTPFFARRSLKYLSSHCACRRCCSCGFTSSKRRHLGVADVLDHDHVPAELRLHRLRRELALRRRDHRVAERLDEVGRRVPVEVAALVLRARILRARLGELVELGALLQLGDDRPSPRLPSRRGCGATLYSLSPICALIVSYSLRRSASGIGFFFTQSVTYARTRTVCDARSICVFTSACLVEALLLRLAREQLARVELFADGVAQLRRVLAALREALLQQDVELTLRVERLVGSRAAAAVAAAAALGAALGAGAAACASAPPQSNAASTATATSVRFIRCILSSGREFVGRVRCDRERMHRVGNQVADAVQNGPMAGEARQPEEVLGHDRHGKVPAAAGRAGVADVLALSSRISSAIGRRSARRAGSRSVAATSLRSLTGVDPSRAGRGTAPWREREQQEQSDAAPDLEVDPRVGRDNGTRRTSWRRAIATKNATHDHVRRVQIGGGSSMSFITQREQVAPPGQLAGGENDAEQPVEHRRLPFDERLVLQNAASRRRIRR